MNRKSILKLTESAVMIALAVGLSYITLFRAPQGGSVTAASMAPIIIISYRHGAVQGLLTAAVYAIVQMIIGFYPPPVESVLNYGLVICLDYLIAFGVLGLAAAFARFESKQASVAFSCVVVMFLRFVCHFASGIVIWGVYAPEGQPPELYSLLYNGSYMLFEAIITTVALVALVSAAPVLFKGMGEGKEAA